MAHALMLQWATLCEQNDAGSTDFLGSLAAMPFESVAPTVPGESASASDSVSRAAKSEKEDGNSLTHSGSQNSLGAPAAESQLPVSSNGSFRQGKQAIPAESTVPSSPSLTASGGKREIHPLLLSSQRAMSAAADSQGHASASPPFGETSMACMGPIRSSLRTVHPMKFSPTRPLKDNVQQPSSPAETRKLLLTRLNATQTRLTRIMDGEPPEPDVVHEGSPGSHGAHKNRWQQHLPQAASSPRQLRTRTPGPNAPRIW